MIPDVTTTATAAPAIRPPRDAAFVSCVVPALDEAANLALLLPRLRAFLERRFERWEIVVVDDGSSDGTAALLEAWAAICPSFVGLQLSRNFGKEAALTAGLEAARGDAVIQLDADLQHPPELIDALVERWRAGADVAYAVRAHRGDEGLVKRLGTRLFYALVRGSGRFELPPDAGDFRLMDRRVVDALLQLRERNRFMKGLYAWIGFKAEAVSYVPDERTQGASRFNLRRLMHLSLDGITGFTTWPLRVVSLVGAALALLAFGYGAWLTVEYLLYGHPVPGWTTVVCCVLLFSGIQLVSVGLLGEYVARIFEEVKQRPLYLVRRRVSGSNARAR